MANSSAASELNGSEIAIIGMACRFPGANDVESFWRKLSTGTELITFLKDDEIAVSAFEPGQANSPDYVKAAPLIDGADLFDAAFFGFSPKEAEIIDPQQRIFLECCWEALETAGYDPERYEGLIGTFGGARTDTYLYNLVSNLGSTGAPTAFDLGLGNDFAFLTTRVSFKLNLRGPSYSVHTACSTSLVAVHLACQSLLIGECNMALAGAVAVNIPQRTGYRYEPGGILSPDGHCRSFDSKAAGTIFGSGAGVVLLKRFEDALADGDHIDAVIKGTATNNDGAMKASFTAPSVQGQARVIADALAAGGVEAQSVSYIEAHGTGTALGDAVEINALNHVFGGALRKYPCPIGAVKTNLGHLDAAAGMAGLIKTVLALQHEQLPPTLHFENPNPKIDFEGGPFFVNRTLVDWQVEKGPRRAGVSSFGIGGANAHVVLEQAPARESSGPSREFRLLTLSARTESALEAASANLNRHLNECRTADLADVAYTLQVGRKAFGHRRFVVASDEGEAAGLLQQGAYLKTATGFTDVANRPIVMMFPGQGSQCVNMAAELYRKEVRFRAEIDACSDLLKPILGVDLRSVLYPGDLPVAEAEAMLRETWLAQPAIFAVEVALARQWMQWGVEPDAMIGHSVGEFAAAHLASVLTLEDALRLVALRGRMMQSMPPGAMVAVEVNEKKARAYLSDDLSLAAVNGAKQCVISGALAALEALERELSKEGLNYKRLRTSHAFHSSMMDPIVDRFEAEVRKTKLNEPAIRYISNVTGTWITDSEATDSRYWGRHLRDTVMLARGLDELCTMQGTVALEVGPGRSLSGLLASNQTAGMDGRVFVSLGDTGEEPSSLRTMLATLGRLWVKGVRVNWAGFHQGERRRRVPLPTYPFERQRYYVELKAPEIGNKPVSLDKNSNVAEWFYLPSWRRTAAHRQGTLTAAANTRVWLVFLDSEEAGMVLVKRLEAAGQSVCVVRAGRGFERQGEREYTIAASTSGHYADLFVDLMQRGNMPTEILHLWGIDSKDTGLSDIESFKNAQASGFYSMLYIAQALDSVAAGPKLNLYAVVNNASSVDARDTLCPEKAPALAAGKVIQQEKPDLRFRWIDIDLAPGGFSGEQVEGLIGELEPGRSDCLIALRGKWRFALEYVRVPLEGLSNGRPPFRNGGVYLIVGGTGGVGLLLTRYLAENFAASVSLTGRTIIPDRAKWEEWLACHDSTDAASGKIRKLMDIERVGIKPRIYHADSSNEDEMRSVISEIQKAHGRIDGVIYAAGVTSGRSVFNPIQNIGKEEAEEQFRSKAHGLYVLERVLKGAHSDFCMLISSNAAVLGGIGFVAYAAANAFMDAFAISRSRNSSTRWVSANWDHWPEETKQYVGFQTSMDQYAMTSEESLRAFSVVASAADEGHIVVSTGDLPSRYDLWVANLLSSRSSPPGNRYTSQASAYSARKLISYSAPTNETERAIALLWQEGLGIDQISIDDNFFDLGGHSLLAMRLVGRIEETLGVDLPLTSFFQAPTIAELSHVISKIQADAEEQEMTAVISQIAVLSDEEIEAEIAKRTPRVSS